MQVVYPHGEDALPWIVLATSDGAFQIWDFASFTLDAEAPEESNKSVEPMASTVLLTKPRVTCLSVCVATDKIGNTSDPAAQKVKKAKKAKRADGKKAAAPAAGVPHVVVELDDAETKADDASKKRKSSDDAKQTSKNKKKKKAQQ